MHIGIGSGLQYTRPKFRSKGVIAGQSLPGYLQDENLIAGLTAGFVAGGFKSLYRVETALGGKFAALEHATAAGEASTEAFWNVAGAALSGMGTSTINAITASKERIDWIYWDQGQADTDAAAEQYGGIDAATAISNYKTATAAIWNAMRVTICPTNPTRIPIIVGLLGRRTSSAALGMERIRQAQLDLIAAGTNVWKAPEFYDLELRDSVHPTDAAIISGYGPRVAATCVSAAYHKNAGLQGPAIASWTKIDANTVDVAITPDSGDTITQPASPGHFRIEDSGTPGTALAISGYAWNGNTLRITLSDALTNDPVGFYPYDYLAGWTGTNIIKGTLTGYPLQTWHRI